MQTLEIKPPRLNYLLHMFVFALILSALTSFVGILFFRDDLHGFSGTKGGITGFMLGTLLSWAYDEVTHFKRWRVALSDYTLSIPDTWFKRKSLPLSELNLPRTIELIRKTVSGIDIASHFGPTEGPPFLLASTFMVTRKWMH